VKPNRHLGEMSAVNKVPEKQREGMRPKSHGGNSAHELKSPEKPKSAQQENDNGDVHMDDGTAEEEKVKHSTEQDRISCCQLQETT
jgi:hypothetical protein